MINWDDVKDEVDALYDTFKLYAKKYRGFSCYPACSEIKLWYEFMEFIVKVEALNKQDRGG